MVGKIVVDFTFLREEGLIRPVMGGMNSKGKRVGKKHYKVTYDMAIRVVDRDLQCKFMVTREEQPGALHSTALVTNVRQATRSTTIR